MWQIIRNEWTFLGRNKMLVRISLGILLLLVIALILGNYQTAKQTLAYETAQQHLREQWLSIKDMDPHSAAHYGTYVFKPTNLLSSLDEGVATVTGNVLRLEGHVQNEIVHSEASQMQAVSKFGKLKSSLILQYIIPILLIFLAFHSVSTEKQSGRLKLLLLQGSKPSSIVFGKALAVWLYGTALLSLVIFGYTIVNLSSINFEIITRTLLFFIIYAIYYFIVSGLTVFFSARWQNATVTLTSMLGIWIVWTIFFPNILMTAIEKWHELPSREQFQADMKLDRSKGIDGHNPSDKRQEELKAAVLKEYGADSLQQLDINFDGIRMQADEDYGNKVWDKHFGKLRDVLKEQKKTYQLGGVFNPFISLQNASMGFTASDNLHHQEFLLQAETYRRFLIKTLNDEHAYGGSKTGEWSWKANQEFYSSIPDFKFLPIALNAVILFYLLDVLLLLFWLIVVVFLLIIGTRKLNFL